MCVPFNHDGTCPYVRASNGICPKLTAVVLWLIEVQPAKHFYPVYTEGLKMIVLVLKVGLIGVK